MKTNIFLIWALAGAMVSCEVDKLNITAPDVNVNGGPVESSLTPTSARVQVIISATENVKEVGILYGLQTDQAALVNYGAVISSTEKKSEYLFDVTDCESATRYSYVAYALLESGEVAYSVVRSFTTVAAELSATPSRLSLDASAQTGELAIATTFDGWSYTSGSEAWLVYQKQGDRLLVTATENFSDERRVATVKFTAGSRTLSVAITQEHRTVTLSSDSVFMNTNGSGSFTVETDASTWSARSDASWLTCSKDGQTVNFEASAPDVPYRVGHVIVTLGTDGMTAIFTVVQYQVDLTALAGEYTPRTIEKSRDSRGDFLGTVLTKEQFMNLEEADFEWAWDRRGDFGSYEFDYIVSGDGKPWVYPLLFTVHNEESPYAEGCLRVEIVAFMESSNSIVSDQSYYDPKLREIVFYFEFYESYFDHTGWDKAILRKQ
ncbi:MAG: hypothetical protein LBD64_02905 [Odoribacteraceae bacterium]|jgi:hypothetical protein|nr:hypothetical protein [Odoribacteraceae bacterium]